MSFPRIVTVTIDRYLWCVRPYLWSLSKYWSNRPEVVLGSDVIPSFTAPKCRCVEVPRLTNDYTDWADRWRIFLSGITDEFVVMMLEDFWLIERVDIDRLEAIFGFLCEHEDVARVALTDYLMEQNRSEPCESFPELRKALRNAQYYTSCQASIWRRQALLEALYPGDSAWHFEEGPGNKWREKWAVYGPTTDILRYVRTVNRSAPRRINTIDFDGACNRKVLRKKDWNMWKQLGILPKDIEIR